MSLYYDAASIIEDRDSKNDSLKLTVFGAAKTLRSPAPQLLALLSGTLSWNNVLVEIIERAEILKQERKLTPELSLVLVHDLLFARKGISAPAAHALRESIERHKTRLHAELTKLRIREGCASVEALKVCQAARDSTIGSSSDAPLRRPRWVRINTLKTTLDEQLKTTFRGFKHVSSLDDILKPALQDSAQILHVDQHVPCLIAIPLSIDITGWKEYRDGKFILQDKASCFPAYLLDPTKDDYVIDACAAPGNKTTHVAALLAQHQTHPAQRIWACERDKGRARLLQQMVDTAGAGRLVAVRGEQDFLKLQSTTAHGSDTQWTEATALLLDPSCSGSGIIGRDENIEWQLPSQGKEALRTPIPKKRKRNDANQLPPKADDEAIVSTNDSLLQDRLRSLAAFQLKLLLHAFSFPKVLRITYSTCSVHEEENELVVLTALASTIAKDHGWKILPRSEQVDGMKNWHLRGNKVAFTGVEDPLEVTESCIRCSKVARDGTQGFFVAAFQRSPPSSDTEFVHEVNVNKLQAISDAEEEWGGFSDASC